MFAPNPFRIGEIARCETESLAIRALNLLPRPGTLSIGNIPNIWHVSLRQRPGHPQDWRRYTVICTTTTRADVPLDFFAAAVVWPMYEVTQMCFTIVTHFSARIPWPYLSLSENQRLLATQPWRLLADDEATATMLTARLREGGVSEAMLPVQVASAEEKAIALRRWEGYCERLPNHAIFKTQAQNSAARAFWY